ncbi:MAG: class I SAM-dependent DNA methyltransferase, partial [Bdellovibrionaceae bacterium]|nr:class I SAM-dependent DNA methyltransferase [Pseudobdellovibrionaceae bacterium]
MSDTGWTAFHSRWGAAGGAERANYQLFLTELCDLLEVPRPEPAGEDTGHNAYVFERAVPLHQTDGSHTTGRIDLYKRGCFVLEAKQYSGKPETSEPALPGETTRKKSSPVRGTERWDDAMLRARSQAEGYARNLPVEEEPPPFVLVVDVGHTIELYADFTQKGKAYQHFPDPLTFRIRLADLEKEDVRARLRAVWTDPLSLDPARRSAVVTREVAEHLAELAKSFEAEKHAPQLVAEFLSRCLFCMFAEDVGLLPKNSFSGLLESVKGDPGAFVPLLEGLFNDMAKGTDYSLVLRQKILRFNGGLFEDVDVLRVNAAQLGLLRAAARLDWRNVEPAIFGTLLERALSTEERHKLGAHYTPRAYVERLVLPTIIEPLRTEWDAVKTAAVTRMRKGDYPAARKELTAFHRHLCAVTVLDPACGSGNFLYVTMELMKRLEGEIIDLLDELGVSLLELESVTVDPHQFHGIELNPRAAAITDLVLWIGYLQWHFRTRGSAPPAEPILRKFRNIECRDAVLAYDKEEPVLDEQGKVVTAWDRRSYKVDPLTGREVPDESRQTWLRRYTDPRPAEWPQTDYIVGNPPFLGASRLREDLGDGYAGTLRETYPDIPESADFVMVWWHKAAELVRAGKAKRFGLITTNSLRQTFNRRVVQAQLKPQDGPRLSLVFAIPDHPWVDTAEGAAVRIAMTVGRAGEMPGHLFAVAQETDQDDGAHAVRFR